MRRWYRSCHSQGVYQVTVRLTSRAEKAQEMLQALRSVMLPAEFEAGSMGCHLYAEAGETDSFCYVEEWATEQDMERTIRSIRFGRLLAIMECAIGLPTLQVRLISETRGWNYIRQLRGEYGPVNGGNGAED
jgi:quinol monooxygenase YgiN